MLPKYISNSNYVGLTTETQTYISTLPAGKYRLAYSNNNLSTDRYAYSDVFEVTYTLTFIDKPTSSLLTYNGSEQQGIADNDAYTISGTYKATDANTYTATVTLKDGYKWSDGTTDKTISVDWTINKKSIDIPTAKTGLVYNGTPQQGIEAGEGYTFVREHIQTNAGGYVAVVSLKIITMYGKTIQQPIKKYIGKLQENLLINQQQTQDLCMTGLPKQV